MMEKTGDIREGNTPDIENKLPKDKKASTGTAKEAVKKLDDDPMHRLANAANK